MPCGREPGTGGAFSERIHKCQMKLRTNAREVTDDPMGAGGPNPGTVGSNRIPLGWGKMTGEKTHPAGVSPATAEWERTDGKRSSISTACVKIRDK